MGQQKYLKKQQLLKQFVTFCSQGQLLNHRTAAKPLIRPKFQKKTKNKCISKEKIQLDGFFVLSKHH